MVTGCPAGQFSAQYFSNTTLTGTPTRTACEATINNVWGAGGPAGLPVDNFSVRWTGRFNFAGGGATFTARADDGIRVFLDGTQIIDGWRDQPATTYTANYTLPPLAPTAVATATTPISPTTQTTRRPNLMEPSSRPRFAPRDATTPICPLPPEQGRQ